MNGKRWNEDWNKRVLIFSSTSVIIYNMSKSNNHGIYQFSPVIRMAAIPIPNPTSPFEKGAEKTLNL